MPKGCFSDGPSSRAVKSMSLMATFQTSGPKTTSRIISISTIKLTIAMRWRQKRRHASRHSETGRTRRTAGMSAVADARVEPAIDQIGEEVEQDHEASEDKRHGHDHRGVVAQDCVDQQRADAGNTEDLLGDDGRRRPPASSAPPASPPGSERCARRASSPLRARAGLAACGGHVVEADHVEHRRAHITSPARALEQSEHGDRHDRLFELFPPPLPAGGAEIGAVDERQPVERDREDQDEQDAGEKVGNENPTKANVLAMRSNSEYGRIAE